jgi:heterodisulfide reductase subunit B
VSAPDRFAFFPGCISTNLYPGIERATRLVMAELGYELVDAPFACCPPPGVLRSYDEPTWAALGARNLAVAAREGLPVLTICNGCWGSLHETAARLREDGALRGRVVGALEAAGVEGAADAHGVEVLHILDVLGTPEGRRRIADRVQVRLGTPVAVHYGCHWLRPSARTGRRVESVRVLDDLVEAAGLRSVPFEDKLSCCGAGGGVWSGSEATSLGVLGRKLDRMVAAGAQAVVNVCPFCHLQFDQGQARLGARAPRLPSVHLSQVLGLAFGMKGKSLGLHLGLVPAREMERRARQQRAAGTVGIGGEDA